MKTTFIRSFLVTVTKICSILFYISVILSMTDLEHHTAKFWKNVCSESQVQQDGVMPFTEITTTDA